MRVEVERTVRAGGLASRGVCEAAAMLGSLVVGPSEPEPGRLSVDVGGGVVVLCGPSGSGKSTLLGDVARACEGAGCVVLGPGVPGGACGRLASVDAVRRVLGGGHGSGSVRAAMSHLSAFGLGDLRAFSTRACDLSDGQRARLGLALLFARGEAAARRGGRVVVCVDELGGALDGETALALAMLVRRRVSGWRERVVGAGGGGGSLSLVAVTNRSGVARVLGSGCGRVVRLDSAGRIGGVEAAGGPAGGVGGALGGGVGLSFRFGAGGIGAYRALRGHHYRAGDPATVDRVVCCWARGSGALAGVLVTSMPVLNASWRERAWPGVFGAGTKRSRALALNGRLRCISRVIVEPRFRGLGVARGLVRSYLGSASTEMTEAVAAMGAVCPFFERAGMRGFVLGRSAQHARLLDCLEQMGVERWRLAQPGLAFDRVARCGGSALLERELRVWARGSGATGRYAGEPVEALFRRAAGAVGGEKSFAYAFGGGVGCAPAGARG